MLWNGIFPCTLMYVTCCVQNEKIADMYLKYTYVLSAHTVPENVKKLKDYLESILHTPVYNPSGLNLSIRVSWQHFCFSCFEFRSNIYV